MFVSLFKSPASDPENTSVEEIPETKPTINIYDLLTPHDKAYGKDGFKGGYPGIKITDIEVEKFDIEDMKCHKSPDLSTRVNLFLKRETPDNTICHIFIPDKAKKAIYKRKPQISSASIWR